MTRALIIDDEPAGCDALRTLLRAHPDITVTGEAGTVAEARAALHSLAYDLVFLDIQLIGGTGFDLVPEVRPGARVIFVTAYDRHALRAFEVNALDYLLKPVAPDRLALALRRLPPTGPAAAAGGAADGPRFTGEDRVLLKLGAGSERFVRVADIRCIASEENYSAVSVGPRGERLLVRKTMKAWEESLPDSHFVRVHRQTIVNAAHARGLVRVTDAVYHVAVDGLAEPVIASHRYVPALRDCLARLRG